MAMAVMAAMPLGGAGVWRVPVDAGRWVANEVPSCVGTGRWGCRSGEGTMGGKAVWLGRIGVSSCGAGDNRGMREVGYGGEEEVINDNGRQQNSVVSKKYGPVQVDHTRKSKSKPHGTSQQISLAFSSAKEIMRDSLSWFDIEDIEEESSLRVGRRDFSSMCTFGFLAGSFAEDCGAVLAEEGNTKPAKKKGRAPSSPYDEDRLLEQNRRMQRLNNAPTEFPGFVREGFRVKVIINDKYVTSKTGLIYYDMVVGGGDAPLDGQQVIFHYTGYNESGRRVDSSYQQGRPARTRLGIQGMIPGFEEGIKSMRPGGRRIIIIPPELGPPVGPSTFFSAKQFEVFDVELLEARDCSRRTLLFYSDVVCE